MADEGRQISQGTNRGEAVFLGDSTFDPVANARRVGETIRMEREKRDKQQEEDLSLLNDNIKTKWDTDTFNYFEPRIGQLKSTIIDAFKKQEGKLTPIQRMEFKNAWDGIRNEAEVSNATFNAYANQVKMLDQNPDKYDLEESRANLNILRDPLSNPETKKEVEQMYGGNVLKWRADNAEKYALVPAYSREGFVQDLMKGKGLEAQAVYDRAADGKPIAYKTETGTYEYRGKKGVTDNQIKSKVEAIWGDTDRKSQRTRQQDLEAVKEKFIIDEMGRPVLVDETDTLSQEVLKNANLKGKTTPDEIYKELGKSFTFTDLRQRFPQSDIRQPIANKPMGRTSGGKGDDNGISEPSQRSINVSYLTNQGDKETTETTTDSSISIKPTKVTMTTSPRTVDLNGNTFIGDSKVRDIEYGQMDVVPVWRTGPNKGKVVADSFLKNPKLNNSAMIEYTVISFGNAVEGMGTEATQRSIYTPTTDIIGALTSQESASYKESLKKAFAKQQQVAEQKNRKLRGEQQSAQPSKPNTGGIKPVNNPLVTKKSR